MLHIIGFDQSYTSSGFCVMSESNDVIDFGVYKSDKELDVYNRAISISDFIIELIKKYTPMQINLEGLAFGIRGDATRDLAGLLFVIVTTIRRNYPTIIIRIIAPTSLKKFATGSGKSDKKAMMAAVPAEIMQRFMDKKLKKSSGLTDVTDAYWLVKYKNL